MRTFALAALCAILGQCHGRESAPLSRPKRTLRMLESLLGSMRDTFGPLTAPAAQPPSEVILATKYPVGVKYALYPTVRMHIRPIQQHVIYMQSIPAIPAPVLRPLRPLHAGGGGVEILRPMAPPMVRLPKTQTTTTIHYEIIPLPMPMPVPVHSEPPAPPAFSSPSSFSSSPSSYSSPSEPALGPPPPPPPPPSSSSPFSYDEADDPSAPWSLDELPPPVPTSAPLNPLDEPNVPWNLHALPPPVATKQPRGNEAFGWPLRSAHQHAAAAAADDGYTLPAVFDKKLVIPAQSVGSHHRHRSVFRASPLQSEISVQPSVEVAAYSETQTLAQQPDEYVKRLRNLNSPRPQVFPNRNNRLRREAPSAYAVNAERRTTGSSPRQQPVPFDGAAGHQRPPTSSAASRSTHPSQAARPHPPHFDSRLPGSADTRPRFAAAGASAAGIGRDIRLSTASAAETSPPERFVLITPRPVDHGRRALAEPARAETRHADGYSPAAAAQLRGSNLLPLPRHRGQLSAWLDGAEPRLRFPPTGSLTKAPRRPQQRPWPFSSSEKSPSLSVDSFFDDRPSGAPAATAAKGHGSQFWPSDLDNVEYFEPIIIDIGGGGGGDDGDPKRRRTDLGGAKVEFELSNAQPKKSTRREPLRLPGRLHETVDRLREALLHPPIFDVESEANEPHAVVLLVGNDVA